MYAGTINQQGSFDYRVTATTQNTLLARIIHSVEQAQSKRAPIQRLVDRFARVYTPIILTIAVLVALVPPLFFPASWYTWIYKALVFAGDWLPVCTGAFDSGSHCQRPVGCRQTRYFDQGGSYLGWVVNCKLLRWIKPAH